MRFLAASLLIWLCLARVAGAETATVRSGEHDGFTRLVIRLEPATRWVLGRGEGGYELRLQRLDVDLDASRVFDLIPRSRISEVAAPEGGSALRISVAEGNHATAFQTPAGAIVIDVASGPPPEGSPFEEPVGDGAFQSDPAAETPVAPDPEARVEAGAATSREPGAPAATPGGIAFLPNVAPRVSYSPESGPDPLLPVYWKDSFGPETRAVPEVPASGEDPTDAAKIGPPGHFDPRVAEAEAHLLMQLGRAASQGLIEPAQPSRRAPRPPEPAHGEAVAGVAPEAGHPENPPQRPDLHHAGPASRGESEAGPQQSVHAETSIDRESLSRPGRAPVTAEGEPCLGSADLAISDWADERPFVIQLAEARNALVGEFDISAPDAVEKLARLYLHFGFGAEAKSVLRAFGVFPKDASILDEIATILDDSRGSEEGPFAAMTDCDSAAALWAVLALPRLEPGRTVNHRAVLRTFSGLPLHLRRQLGIELSNRFLAIGEADVARGVRDAIARAPGEHGAAVSMIDAQLDLAEGDAEAAEHLLDAVVAEDGSMTPKAVILAIQSRLDRGATVEPRLLEAAAVLAFEHRKAADGPELSRVHILALATEGSFDEAFLELDRWSRSGDKRLQAETTIELFSLLAQPEAEPVFLRHYFSNRDMLDAAAAPGALRMAISERLLDQGFTDEARRVAGPGAQETETGRLFLARAALADDDPAAALWQLAGMNGAAATRLRGDALGRLGRHEEAAAAYLAADVPGQAGPEAWRAGDWAQVATLGSKAQRAAVEWFGLAAGAEERSAESLEAEAPGTSVAEGPLARGRALLDDSRAARATLEALLGETAGATEAGSGAGG